MEARESVDPASPDHVFTLNTLLGAGWGLGK